MALDFVKEHIDGFVKSPEFFVALHPRCFSVRQVRIIAQDLRASNLGFSLPSKSSFLRFLSTLTLKIVEKNE
ncbi:MAG: hypothetical protein R2874_15230 [Desulfobacterales bacterium]